MTGLAMAPAAGTFTGLSNVNGRFRSSASADEERFNPNFNLNLNCNVNSNVNADGRSNSATLGARRRRSHLRRCG